MKQLVSTEWLEKNINEVKILDASWHLPNSKRDAMKEFETHHIKNSIFFDIDKNSNKDTHLPHMLPGENEWEIILSNLGIKNCLDIITFSSHLYPCVSIQYIRSFNIGFTFVSSL